jgi:penicillin-binding protein 1A
VCKNCSNNKANSEIDQRDAVTGESVNSDTGEQYAPRIIDARVAYIMDSILKDVVDKGTGFAAKALGRTDLAGKTGTTNGPRDLWFSGYNPNLITTVWVGIDKNTPLGRREFGSTAALPIWMDFMRTALEGMPNQIVRQPDGIVTVRINTETGKPAQPGDVNTAFEIFPTEISSITPKGLGEEPAAETLPEGVL